MYCNYKCSVALPHGAVGWSAVCDLVFPDHTHLLFKQFCSFFVAPIWTQNTEVSKLLILSGVFLVNF